MRRHALYTATQARELDRIAIEECGHPSYALMSQAGYRAFIAISTRFGPCQNIVVVCGKGNNGGDGYIVASWMRRGALPVHVLESDLPATEDARRARQEYLDAGGEISNNSNFIDLADLIVDAALGSGLKSAPHGVIADWIQRINSNVKATTVSLDLPSGLDGDTGHCYDPGVKADLTVSFIADKIGLHTGQGRELVGELVIEDLDLQRDVFAGVTADAETIQCPAISERPQNSHKGRFGRVMVAGGDCGMLGAILLAGDAALRTGAGTVTLLSHEKHQSSVSLYQPAMMSLKYETSAEFAASSLETDVIVMGPGTAESDWSNRLLQELITLDVPRVIDAGGLRCLANQPQFFGKQVLTPHPGEAAALLGSDSQTIQRDRVGAAREISQRYGGVCVLKGAGTVVTDGQYTGICDLGNPGMATAGTGDVLAGIIGALLGQGYSVIEAARAGVWLHAYAGDLSRDRLGEHSMIASDIIARLADAIRHCLR